MILLYGDNALLNIVTAVADTPSEDITSVLYSVFDFIEVRDLHWIVLGFVQTRRPKSLGELTM